MDDFDDMSYTGKPKTSITLKRLIKRLKVGAVISPEYFSSSEVNQWILDGKKFGVLTSIAGMNRFSQTKKYQRVNLFADGEINDEMNESVISYARTDTL